MPAELAHDLGLSLLKSGIVEKLPRPRMEHPKVDLTSKAFGMDLSHPIGLAAGFDKNAAAYLGFAHLGLSFIEIGTLTPKPQKGNPKPRMFRQSEQRGLVNRMGFNNIGVKEAKARLSRYQISKSICPLGINIGKNKTTPMDKAIDDYLMAYEALKGLGSYYVVNISSPNTPGLRDLASKEFITSLANSIESEDRPKFWIKLDPDLSKVDFQTVVETITEVDFKGLILTNTHRVTNPEMGGQSGHPISVLSTKMLEWAFEVHRGNLSMIGSGGVLSGIDVLEKVIRGADLVQIYSALVYRGMWVVFDLLQELENEMQLRGFKSLAEAKNSFYNS